MPTDDQDAADAVVYADLCTSAVRNTLHAARLRKDRRRALSSLLAAISNAEDNTVPPSLHRLPARFAGQSKPGSARYADPTPLQNPNGCKPRCRV